MIQCILFDLDGVLVDACEWHYLALNKAMMELTGKVISRQDHETIYNGLPTRVKLEKLGIVGDLQKKICDLKQKYTIDIINTDGAIDNTKVTLLSNLKSRGVKIACVTNSIRQTAELMLKVTGQLEFMDLIISNEDVVNSKPSPEPYNKAIKTLLVNPLRTMIVEDSEHGLRSATLSDASFIWKVKGVDYVNLGNFYDNFGDIDP
jgi:HAD superfamily hydrolase (TIGR01509 family)